MRVAIIENTEITHQGAVGVALHEAGALVTQFRPWLDAALPDPARFDAVVAFGGEQSALSDATHPYLPGLARTLRAFSDVDKPVLAICLGAQVLARAYGAANHIGTAPEFGWCQIELSAQGRADPVFAALPPVFPIFEWHSDTFTLPANARLLAQSGVARNQAFRIGRATYGTQFHFEASRAVVADWTRRFPQALEAMSPGWARAFPEQAETHGRAADLHGLTLARAWVRLI